MPQFEKPTPFAPREMVFRGVSAHVDWRMKCYDIVCDHSCAPDDAAWISGEALAFAALPAPAVSANRPGVAIKIRHAGRDVLYLVLAWWDNQNELITQTWVRLSPGDVWKPGADAHSFCVWDLEILWHERNAFVRHVLAERPDLDAYLGDTMPTRRGARSG